MENADHWNHVVVLSYKTFRFIAQSDVDSSNPILKLSAEGIHSLEQQINDSGLDAVILRYGKLYGNATGSMAAESCRVHVDAAAYAAIFSN